LQQGEEPAYVSNQNQAESYGLAWGVGVRFKKARGMGWRSFVAFSGSKMLEWIKRKVHDKNWTSEGHKKERCCAMKNAGIASDDERRRSEIGAGGGEENGEVPGQGPSCNRA